MGDQQLHLRQRERELPDTIEGLPSFFACSSRATRRRTHLDAVKRRCRPCRGCVIVMCSDKDMRFIDFVAIHIDALL